jgi:ribosomal protein S18 acetylase RimI-like enzyme
LDLPVARKERELVNVRRAGPDDAAAVATVWLRSRQASVPAIPPPVHDDEDVRAWVRDILVPAGATWVSETDGVVVAMLTVDDGEIDQLYVDPNHTGRGVGSDLVTFAKSLCPDGLSLWAFQSNERARLFYEARGFAAVEWTDGHNEERAPDVRYVWVP